MDADNITELNSATAAAVPGSAGAGAGAAGAGAAVIPPPADSNGELQVNGTPGQLPSSLNSILKGARLGQKSEQFAIGTAGLTSNSVRGAADKFASVVLPGIAKAVMRAIVPRSR